MTVHGLSVDLEDWYALVARRLYGSERPPSDRVVTATRVLLDLLDEGGTKATFFVLGSVAEMFPALVHEVSARGHEIATHGHDHHRLDAIDEDRFRDELRRSREAIYRACGKRAVGHRAPEFSLVRGTTWAYEVLAREGFTYDSSVFPIKHRRYGIPDAPRAPYLVPTRAGQILELPLATLNLAGVRLPAAGGGYLRLFPYAVIDGAFAEADRAGRPGVLYLHPYEFDPEPLRMRAPNMRGALFVRAQNAFRQRVPSRLRRLLRRYQFGPLAGIMST